MPEDREQIDYLIPEARKALDLPNEERIEFLKYDKFIPYPHARNILKKLDELIKEPKKTRMPCFLIVGESNNGKTSILSHFHGAHPPTDGIYNDAVPVVFIFAPAGPDIHQLYDSIFDELLIPYKKSDRYSHKERELRYHFTNLGVKVLIVDEIHNILSGSGSKQKAFMNTIKNISNKLAIPIVLAGTKDALLAVQTDLQISSRFRPALLPLWKLDRDYVRLLASIEQTLPLKKPSNIAKDKELAMEILDLSDGLIGDIASLTKEAAIHAIETGRECITLDAIKQCGSKPSLRYGLSLIDTP